MGTILTVEGKRTYPVTPETVNFAPFSRDFTSAAVASYVSTNNVTLTPYDKVSWDDRFYATKAEAGGADPAIELTSGAVSYTPDQGYTSGRYTVSLWLMADADNPPSLTDDSNLVTLTLTNGDGSVTETKEISLTTVMDRFAITAPLDLHGLSDPDNVAELTVSWDNPDGVIWLDAWQVERNDYATEYIDNTAETYKERDVFASPDRILGVGRYRPGMTPTHQDVYVYDNTLYPYERTIRPVVTSDAAYSNQGGQLCMENVEADTHVIYRAKQQPPVFDSENPSNNDQPQFVQMPDPWIWVLVEGIRTFMVNAMYDTGTNAESEKAKNDFIGRIEAMIQMSEPSPGWMYLPNNYPRMM